MTCCVKTYILYFIQIVDIDEPPEEITLHYNPVREGLSNITVGIFTAKDPEGRPLTFQINDTTSTFSVSFTKYAILLYKSFYFPDKPNHYR